MEALLVPLIIFLIGVGISALKEIFNPELPADYHNNMKLEQEDADKVRFGEMSRREFDRNMRNGKYR